MKHEVFVYGTLMKHNRNHGILTNSRFIGAAELENYGLYIVSPHFPGIKENKLAKVKGEVYEIDASTLRRLDYLEGEGHLYKREKVIVFLNGAQHEVSTYVWIRDVDDNTFVSFESLPWKSERRAFR